MNALVSYSSGKADKKIDPKPLDPLHVQTHILKNGLKILMSVNKNEPRVFTNIAVRAGSKQDPSDTTGLAHYLEHMMFKGTSQIGSLNWTEESLLLTQIADLYELHRNELDPSVRSQYYAEIDSLSNEAAKFVATNEYDKLVSSLGARATNAYTSSEQTVYVNDIPSNELERWFQLESERFKEVVLRLFHTELETVYEEFNIGQDNDNRKVYQAMMSGLFPSHPYGTQTTIGKGEHLKNPSHYNIIDFFKQYYVPNNMALVLSGDFDTSEVIVLAEKYFGSYKFREVPPFEFEAQKSLTEIAQKEVLGHQAEYIQMAWRMNGISSGNAEIAMMIAAMLHNNQAGLIDLELAKKQQVLEASAGVMSLIDYSAFILSGKPRQGQSLEQVEELLLQQIERIQKGDFPDWLMQAVIKDFKYNQLKNFENNQARVNSMTDSFIKDIDWHTYITRIERLQAITKEQIMSFSSSYFKDNYVVVYKRIGEDTNVMKVEKPDITPVSLNRIDKSGFAHTFLKQEANRLQPQFLDFQKDIKTVELSHSGISLDYIPNTTNDIFSLYYIFDIGRNTDKFLSLAINYLPFLGTDKYSAQELEQEFYKLGLSFDVFCNEERSYIVLNGLNESFTEGVRLLEHILHSVKKDDKALKNMVADIISKRDNDKKDKRVILRHAMVNYAKYGKCSPFTDILSQEALENIDSDILIQKIKNLHTLQHRLFYYGNKEINEVATILDTEHKLSPLPLSIVVPKEYMELPTEENKVFFAPFPMVQTEILMLSKGTPQFSEYENTMASLYNTYFGAGLSSIVFQEIRESRALAYSANAFYSSPSQARKAHYLQAYLGTQPDKLQEAIEALTSIIDEMPIAENQIEQARTSVLKTIESERITKANIYWSYRNCLDRGINYDLRQNIYNTISQVSVEELKKFQKDYVKGRHFTYLILGDPSRIDFDYLNTIGQVESLRLEDIFGY